MKFYKEINFKEAKRIGKIPEKWGFPSLSDVVKTLPGFAFSSEFFTEKEGVPLIRIRDLGDNNTETLYSGPYEEDYLVEKGDVLVSMDGEFNVHIWKSSPALLNQRVMKIFPSNQKELDKLYLYYASQKPLKTFELQIGATTVKHLLKRHLDLIRLPIPPDVDEQQQIASILSTVDGAIQKTDEVSAKTERLKKGLMQKLLTKGIGHKEFKETAIGKFPKEWEYKKLVDFSMTEDKPVQTGPFGAQLHASDYTDDGIHLILIKNVLDGRIVEEDMPFISETKASKLTRYRLKAGDIVFSRVGSIGRRAVIKKHQKGWLISGQMLRVRLENPHIDNNYLGYVIASDWFTRTLAARTVGATRKSINEEILGNLPMVIPPLPEQQEVVGILSTIDKKLGIERTEKARLEKIRRGLMDLLLTGKIRVRVD